MFRVKTIQEAFSIGYLYKSQELVFLSFWFVPNDVDYNINSELIHTKDMLLPVNDEIIIFLNKLGFTD